jgi:hypothetical protein
MGWFGRKRRKDMGRRNVRVVLFVARRKFFTEIVTCRIAESLDLRWLEDIIKQTKPELLLNCLYKQKHFLFQAGPLLVPSDPVTSRCMT